MSRSLAIPLRDVFRGIGPFFVADAVTVGVLLAFPGIVLWLPRTMGQAWRPSIRRWRAYSG